MVMNANDITAQNLRVVKDIKIVNKQSYHHVLNFIAHSQFFSRFFFSFYFSVFLIISQYKKIYILNIKITIKIA